MRAGLKSFINVSRVNVFHFCGTGWWQYESRISAELEQAFKSGEKTIEVIICGELYVIDLETKCQYQKRIPSKRRKIDRLFIKDTKTKGIAGLS